MGREGATGVDYYLSYLFRINFGSREKNTNAQTFLHSYTFQHSWPMLIAGLLTAKPCLSGHRREQDLVSTLLYQQNSSEGHYSAGNVPVPLECLLRATSNPLRCTRQHGSGVAAATYTEWQYDHFHGGVRCLHGQETQ